MSPWNSVHQPPSPSGWGCYARLYAKLVTGILSLRTQNNPQNLVPLLPLLQMSTVSSEMFYDLPKKPYSKLVVRPGFKILATNTFHTLLPVTVPLALL